MAQSRLEKVGTIYSRATGLIQSKALNWEDRPLWYDIYQAFPPKEEPRYDRAVPNLKLKKIFYEDDKIRAIFHRNNKHIGAVSLTSKYNTLTQRFIETYKKISEQYKNEKEITEEKLYKEAIDLMNRNRMHSTQSPPKDFTDNINHNDSIIDEAVSLSTAFKEAQNKQKISGINVRDIFND